NNDVKALAALMAEDGDFITVGGRRLKGRKAFYEHHAAIHVMQFKDSIWETRDVEVKFLKPDVAVVHVSWSMKGDKDPDGTPRQPRTGIFTRVMTKEGGTWLIKASQNTNYTVASAPK
ncbi:MAG: SgcJ/EcaC family oxidoreductase, partial [Pyrinomonadaceae bacterium]